MSEHPVLSAKSLPKGFLRFFPKKTYTLVIRTWRTKSDVPTLAYTVERHINI